MNLKTKFFLLLAGIFAIFSLLVWFYSQYLVTQVNEQWGTRFVEKQVMLDRNRTMMPLMRELALARQLAAEPALVALALHEQDPASRRHAIEVLERYRKTGFQDGNYFVALARSGNYYFNDADNSYANRQLRYTLSPSVAADQWFYATLASKQPHQVNVDPDAHLGVTKLWVNVLIKQGNQVLGVIGTGLDITRFLKESVDIAQPGVRNLFVDRDMAIQLYRDPALIDYASITKSAVQRSRVDALLRDPADIEALRVAMRRLETSGEKVAMLWVDFEGSKHLLGVAYLPELGWFDLSMMSANELAVLHGYSAVPLTFAALFLVALLVIGFMLHRLVLAPIVRLQRSISELQYGSARRDPLVAGGGEITQLMRHFGSLAEHVRNSGLELEDKVKLRTEDLHRLTETDSLTGLLNRRGMMDRLDKEIARQSRQDTAFGLLLLDLDYFKHINDRYGHAVGDQALCQTAEVIQASKRSYDYAARWGGEEFLVLLPECTEAALLTIAERIRAGVQDIVIADEGEASSFTISIGAHYADDAEDQETLLQKVDKALYQAKDAGRNCTRRSE